MAIPVSVILPSLNAASYIRETLDSVCAQTLKKIEIICVDAGSTDGTAEILKEYADKDPRVRLIPSDQKSYGYQMNMGIREARGEYIGIVESDDYVDPRMYEILYQTAAENEADMVKSDFDMFLTGTDGTQYFVPYSLRLMHGVSYGEVYSCEEYRSRRIRVECAIWNAIYKKSFLDRKRIRFQETPGASFQDFGFKYQAAFLAERIVAVEESFYRYRRDNGTSSTYSPRTAEFNLREAQYLLRCFEENNEDLRLMRTMYGEILQYAVWPFQELLRWGTPAENTVQQYEAYRELFLPTMKKGWITEEDCDQDLWYDLQMLLEGADLFCKYCRVRARTDARRVRDFFHRTQEARDLVIFGSGRLGNEARVWLMKNGATNLRAFTDNKESLWRADDRGIPVLSPAEALKSYPSAQFLIATRSDVSACQLAQQLESMGVTKDRQMRYAHPLDPFFCTNTAERDF